MFTIIFLKWSQFILALSCTLLIVACGSNRLNTTGTPTITVATDPTFIPFDYQAPNGKIEGFDIDLINAVSKATGLTVKLETLPFDGMISALVAKKVDAAINGIAITSERMKTISFSRPYMKAGLAIAVREDNQDIKTLKNLQGKKIATQIGSTGADFAKTISGADIRIYNTGYEFFQELINGNVDAVLCDGFATLYAIKAGNLNRIKVVGELLTKEYYGIATQKNSPYLNTINQGIATLLANGTYKQIYRKWFDAKPPELPESVPLS